MKKIITVLLVSIFCAGFAQELPRNRFEEPDHIYERPDTGTNNAEPEVAYNPGNPGDPVPVDMYIPFLLLTAAGLIVYTARKKNNALS